MSSVQSQFVSSKFIEEGPFAGCWEVMDRETGDFHYLKEIRRSMLDNSQKISDFTDEISFISSFKHRLLPSLVDFINDTESFYIVFEKPKQISIYDKIKQNGRFNEKQVQKFICSLIEVVNYFICEDKFSNWQLPFETIYVNDDGSVSCIYPSLSFNSSIINFSELGKSRTTTPEEITFNNKYKDQDETLKIRKKHFTFSVNPKCISWFIGIATYFVSVGCFPFNGKSISVIENSIIHNHPFFPDYLSKPLKNLLSKLLIKNPQVRLDVNKIEDHPFISTDRTLKSLNKTESLLNNLALIHPIDKSNSFLSSFSGDEDELYFRENSYEKDMKNQQNNKQQKIHKKSNPCPIGKKDFSLNHNEHPKSISDSFHYSSMTNLNMDSFQNISRPSQLRLSSNELGNKAISKSKSTQKCYMKSVSVYNNNKPIESNNNNNLELSTSLANSHPIFSDKVSLTPKKYVSILHAYGVKRSFNTGSHFNYEKSSLLKMKKE